MNRQVRFIERTRRVISRQPLVYSDNRQVEINMIFHVLKNRDSYREDMLQSAGGMTANWASTMKKMRENIIVCNYKFLRDMSKDAQDDSWTISGLNHWLPSEYEQQQQPQG